jgi:anti-sigma B factor antagonist
MEISKNRESDKLTLAVSGRLDTTTAPELDAELKEALEGVTELVMDFSELEYISSAGLRVLLTAQKTMNNQGSMELTGCNDTVKEIFEVTGFDSILTIK